MNLLGGQQVDRTKIKICGLSRLCDIEYVNLAMPDYAGFVFWEQSRRNVSIKKAEKLSKALDSSIKSAGVFVNAPFEKIINLCDKNIIDIIQLHGSEDNEYIAKLREYIPKKVIWKAYKVCSKEDLKAAESSAADAVLLDNGYGTGKCFDWSLIEEFTRSFILAGGLTQENICDAIRKFQPYAVDISSGVESEGVKDKEKILKVVTTVRNC
nr:phosphoribosylanthranilate isomerase [Tepidanaerobacter syntrophicus]